MGRAGIWRTLLEKMHRKFPGERARIWKMVDGPPRNEAISESHTDPCKPLKASPPWNTHGHQHAENTPRARSFAPDIGGQYSQETLENATTFIWGLFQQNNESDRKNVERVSLFIDDMDGYIQVYPGDVKTEITGFYTTKMTHIWQWIGNGQPVPDGLIEGIADFVRLKSGYAPTSHWVSAGQGDRWDQGYDVTARFLDYCDQLKKRYICGGT
ncbi:hypothetical protein DH2020_006622 [Rehmannia glutinosa]|uniref:Uncharacterized protein n=1 Tax=Rehmannia glutinosa TaxID=99300 RepID=A0ABR0XJQ5_REHGL